MWRRYKGKSIAKRQKRSICHLPSLTLLHTPPSASLNTHNPAIAFSLQFVSFGLVFFLRFDCIVIACGALCPRKTWTGAAPNILTHKLHTNWQKHIYIYTHCNNIDKRRFAGELQSHQGQFHFLFPEDALEPVQDPVNKRQHVYSVLLIIFSLCK